MLGGVLLLEYLLASAAHFLVCKFAFAHAGEAHSSVPVVVA